MSNDERSSRPERPRSEPEIIPPDQGRRRDGDGYIWTTTDETSGTHRIYVSQLGPFAIIAALIIAGLILAGIVLLLLGLVLFWVPVIVLVVAALLLVGYIRTYWRRLRYWATGR